ncbi:MAG: alpha/beta hydrolase, partial [Psychroflexus sp.]|nr:alpha/beta hydrolase [Psychroflexus sp.]
LILFLCISASLLAQPKEIKVNKYINGTYLEVNADQDAALAILIQGSGPTDRYGNQANMKSDHSKMLYQALNEKGINTFSYDKRSIKMMRNNQVSDKTLFDDFVNDQIDVIHYFEERGHQNIHLIGHSQGSLIAILAAQKTDINSLISIAGTSKPFHKIMIKQIAKQMPQLKDETENNFEKLLKNEEIKVSDNQVIASIFAKRNQKFLSNYMQYDPAEEIKKLEELPILIINGDDDLQVPVSDAEALDEAAKNSELLVIENMNHVFKIINGDQQDNLTSYTDPSHPISDKLINAIEKFIKHHTYSN